MLGSVKEKCDDGKKIGKVGVKKIGKVGVKEFSFSRIECPITMLMMMLMLNQLYNFSPKRDHQVANFRPSWEQSICKRLFSAILFPILAGCIF